MFVIILDYLKPIPEVEKELPKHIQFLDKYYSLGKFICSGRRIPRVGGVILCNAQNMQEVQDLIKEDSFYQKEIAKYTIMEFSPTKYADGFEKFLDS